MPTQSDSGSTALSNNSETVLSTITTAGRYEFAIDLNPLTGGTTPDILLVYPKEKVLSGSTARIVDGFPFNYVGGLVASPVAKYEITVMHSIAFAIQQTQGTLRTFDWSVRRLDDAMGTAGLTAAAVDLVWDEATSGHTTAGTTGKALADAGAAGDPWSTALPGSYGSGTAGKIVGDNINATVSSRLASASITLSGGAVTVGTNNDKTGYALTSGERDSIAAALLDLSNGVETSLTMRNALRAMAAALAGKISGAAGTTVTIRNAVADSKNRIVATVDTDGNRSAITYDFS